MWGNDLSGSQQGAGGVGGLLDVSYHGSSTTNCFPAFDGNGNVMALVNAADGTLAANYDYGPFGEVIRSTGPMAKTNPIRFSTKYDDDESDLLYYGYRYYKPSTGTWPSRDPIKEAGFNLMTRIDRSQQLDAISLSLLNETLLSSPFLLSEGFNPNNISSSLSPFYESQLSGVSLTIYSKGARPVKLIPDDFHVNPLYAFVDNNAISEFDPLGLQGGLGSCICDVYTTDLGNSIHHIQVTPCPQCTPRTCPTIGCPNWPYLQSNCGGGYIFNVPPGVNIAYKTCDGKFHEYFGSDGFTFTLNMCDHQYACCQ